MPLIALDIRNMKIIKNFIWIVLLFSCKKDPIDIDPYKNIPATGTKAELILDSIFMYTNEVWLWQQALPAYEDLKPRKYSPANYKKALYDFVQFQINPLTGEPYEKNANSIIDPKYSFISEYNTGTITRETLSSDGIGYNFGIDIHCITDTDCRIVYVEEGSPAFEAGVKRGDQVLTINNIPGKKENLPLLNAALGSSEIHLSVSKSQGPQIAIHLQRKVYQSTGILTSKIIDHNGFKTAYLALGHFVTSNHAQGELSKVFNNYASYNPKTLIIDLRYNQGGIISSAENLINLIIQPEHDGKIMYSAHYNSMLQSRKATILKNQLYKDLTGKQVYIGNRKATYYDIDFSVKGNTTKIKKNGNLSSVSKIYFIVGPNTASSAEMVINCLRPYMEVIVVGETTYGKPVGSFAINIDKYRLFLASFLIKNAQNSGDYFDGIVPDYQVSDDYRFDFGNENENCLNQALRLIEGHHFMPQNKTSVSYLKRTNPYMQKDSHNVN